MFNRINTLLRAAGTFAIGATLLASCNNDSETALIRAAVERQMQDYPELELRDVYKSFFQDHFGPGHIISDTAAADNYLRQELAQNEQFGGIMYEPTGYNGNFYRVNLKALKSDAIDYPTFFNAFIKSANAVNPPTIEEWSEEWHSIVSIISQMNPRPGNFESDSIEIENIMQQGNYVMHHSRAFNEKYNVHYRIIHRDIVEKEIQPLIAQHKEIALQKEAVVASVDQSEFLKDFYTDYILTFQKDFAEAASEICTPRLLKYLADEYEYDCPNGDCYAIWRFRTGCQDGPSDERRVEDVSALGKDWYEVRFIELGNHGVKYIHFAESDGTMKMDELSDSAPAL